MSDKIFTQADIDAAIADAKAGLESKRDELLDEVKKLKAEVRRSQEIKPEDLTAAEERADKAEAALKAAQSEVTKLTKERDTAVKSLESETGAARKYAIDAEINAAIAEGNVTSALAPAFRALVGQGAAAELVDGAYVVKIGDKTARDHIKELLSSDDGKHFVAAPANHGGGAQGGKGGGSQGKSMTRDQFNELNPLAQAAHVKDGGTVVDQAA